MGKQIKKKKNRQEFRIIDNAVFSMLLAMFAMFLVVLGILFVFLIFEMGKDLALFFMDGGIGSWIFITFLTLTAVFYASGITYYCMEDSE